MFGITFTNTGENNATFNTVLEAHNALMASAGHKANILSAEYDEIGIGIVLNPENGKKMFTQMFIRKSAV